MFVVLIKWSKKIFLGFKILFEV